MAITAKELMSPPRFEVFGTFARAAAANGDWSATWEFNCLGAAGGVRVSVDDAAMSNLPREGDMFLIAGTMRMSARNGAVFLEPTSRRFVKDLSEVPIETFGVGLQIKGVAKVVDRKQSTFQRQTYLRADLSWTGGSRQFKDLPPELFAKVSAKDTYGRFVFGLTTFSERNASGQMTVFQSPLLISWERDVLEGVGVSPSSSASSSVAGASSVKPGVSASAAGVKG